ncbi:type I 3-dehydroquinate dehydratase [Myxococcota bacterium]|nr:type I 3-dehydroquinate dehydratase [Myxococcota bacterium]
MFEREQESPKGREIAYCLSIASGTWLDASRAMEQCFSVYRYVELWLDLVEGVEIEEVRALCRRWPDRIVLLFRRPQLAAIQMPQTQRVGWLVALAAEPVWFDLDTPTQAEDLRDWFALPQRPKLILSHHDYTTTPSEERLAALLAEMKACEPTVIKIATYCQQPEDALRLLRWQVALRREGLRVIVLGMGEHGVITRIFGALWGNEMSFAPPTPKQASAPGQLTREQMEAVFALLRAQDEI